MKPLGRIIAVILVLGLAVGGFVLIDQRLRASAEQQINEAIMAEFGGQVSTELGGWPFLLARVKNRIPDARVSIVDAQVSIDGRATTVDRTVLTAVGLSPIDDFRNARAERLDVRVEMTWQQLTELLGFPVSHVVGDRVSARTSVEILGVVAVLELQAELSVQSDGTLVLSDATGTAAGLAVPIQIVQLGVDKLLPQLRLPTMAGMSYQGLEIGPDSIAANLTGQDVALGGLR